MRLIAENQGRSIRSHNSRSLFTVCAVALSGADEFRSDIADGVRKSVQHVLEWGEVLAFDLVEDVEVLENGKAVSK